MPVCKKMLHGHKTISITISIATIEQFRKILTNVRNKVNLRFICRQYGSHTALYEGCNDKYILYQLRFEATRA